MTITDDPDPATTALELRGLIGRIEQLLEVVPAPLAATDAYGNPGAVAAGELIESAWGNATAQRVVYRFPTKVNIDAFAAPNGTLAVSTSDGAVYIRDAGTWKATALGRTPTFRIQGAAPGQSMPPSAIQTAAFAAEIYDDYNVLVGGIFTVPAGWAGRWRFDWAVEWPGPSSGVRQGWINSGSARLGGDTRMTQDSAAQVSMAGSVSVVLAVGNQVSVGMFHTHVGGLLCNATGNQYFQGHYEGHN